MFITAVIALLTLIGIPLFSSSSASSKRDAQMGEPVSPILFARDSNEQKAPQKYARNSHIPDPMLQLTRPGLGSISAPLRSLFQALPEEGVATYAVDNMGACTTTPQITFSLGDRVCARVVSAPPGQRRINWIGASGFVASSDDVLTEENIFLLPTSAASRGLWIVGDVSSADGSLYAAAAFTVRDPQNLSTDMAINMANSFEAASGGNLSFILQVANNGPDTAQNIVLTNLAPAGTSFLGITQEPGGPMFDCDPGAGFTCTTASFTKGAMASFTIVYQVAPATPDGTIISNTATITSSTTELKPGDNSVLSDATVSASADTESCTLACPADIVITANTTQSGQPGAIVNYAAAQGFGSCGSISNNPPSGTFFTVGLHTVTSTSSEGPTCTFTVNVLDSAAPTITCPADRILTALDGAEEATAVPAIGLPTTNPATGVTVVGIRSDSIPAVVDDDGTIINPAISVPLTDPYPVGITGITWTVTDAAGRTATCQQRVVVNGTACGSDTEPPTITAPADITAFTGPNNTGCTVGLDDELGQATALDNCTVTVSIAGIPANNAFPPGTTILTYTATDGVGQTASDTQVVTVIDNTPPVIAAPPDASYVCLSDVPAASPSQATRGIVVDENGDPLPPGPPFDNCGIPTVTVSETSTGVGSAASPRIITRTFTATDASPLQNSASSVQTITVIDATPPTISCPANIVVYLPANTTDTSMAVSYPAVTGSDNCGTPTITSSPASGSIFPVGTTAVNATATDAVGNTASCQFTVTVLYNFTGFFSPVGNAPVLNSVNAGRAIPVKFSLSGNKGLDIFAANNPYSVSLTCGTSDIGVDVTETLTAGGSSLSYGGDQYNYVWKTESSWAGTCRQLVVTLNDGSVHVANFKFR